MGNTKKYLKKYISKERKLNLKLKLFFLLNTINQCIDTHKGKGERESLKTFLIKTSKTQFSPAPSTPHKNFPNPQRTLPLDYPLLFMHLCSRFLLSIIHFHDTLRIHQTDIRLILFTSSRFFSGVTDAHPLEGTDVDGGVARHQAGVVTAQKVGTFLAIGLTYKTRTIYIIV